MTHPYTLAYREEARRWIYRFILRPVIVRNYGMRERGTAPDELYWADRLAMSWGHFTDFRERI
jgi:hypothetical protein